MTPGLQTNRRSGWRQQAFVFCQAAGHFCRLIPSLLALLAVAVLAGHLWFGHVLAVRSVTVYCAQDQVYAEPLFRDFEKRTGIKVRAVFDSEAVKTVGLANRLLAERRHPVCDVFWGNEEMRTRLLAAKGVFRETIQDVRPHPNPLPQERGKTSGWVAFGARTRRIVINTNLLSASAAPTSLLELTNRIWAGKVALAYPQFGTTATHFHALRQKWGEPPWLAWCSALAANKPFLVDGNSVVVKLVGRGEAWLGLTDSDDIAAGQREGLPVQALPLNPESLLIPNTVGEIRGAPEPAAAQMLFEFLSSPETARALVKAGALEMVSPPPGASPMLEPDWEALLRDLDHTTAELNRIFLR